MKRNTLLAIGAALIAGFALITILATNDDDSAQHEAKLPNLTKAAQKGAQLYAANCSVCHGKDATGTKKGPPFIHKIYEPSHHGDASFQRAAKNGVRAHHWPFGNMAPVPAVNSADVKLITKYIRELQRANGIQ